MPIQPGDIISYLEMCAEEGASLQRGMNFRLNGYSSIILMSLRPNAPYADRVEDGGKILIYEGHDIARIRDGPDPKNQDQPLKTPSGKLTQNGKFFQAAKKYQEGKAKPEIVRVYEKIRNGIWVFNGTFNLVDAWLEHNNARSVFKFRLELTNSVIESNQRDDIDHNRLIPASVKLEVWKRDKGRCVRCGSKDNLHFDHIIPFSKGGSSLTADNIQLLCVRHNLSKHDKIE